MLGEATGKTELDWLVGGSSSRVLALPEGLSLGPSLPWFILLRENANHARCFCLHPGPHQGPGKFSTHTSSGSSRQRGSLPGPSAQCSLSQQPFLEVLFIFSVSTSSPPCHCFSPCGLAPRRPHPRDFPLSLDVTAPTTTSQAFMGKTEGEATGLASWGNCCARKGRTILGEPRVQSAPGEQGWAIQHKTCPDPPTLLPATFYLCDFT